MLLPKLEVPLSRVPNGYRCTSQLRVSKQLATFERFAPGLVYLIFQLFFCLNNSSYIGDQLGQQVNGNVLLILTVCGVLATMWSRGTIQRLVSRLLGYPVVWGMMFLVPGANTYTAAPGHYQSRRNICLITLSPLMLFLLFWLLVLWMPSGIIQMLVIIFLLGSTLGTVSDLAICWQLWQMPVGTLLYTESIKSVLVLEPDGTSALVAQTGLVEDAQAAVSVFDWQSQYIGKEEARTFLSQADEDLLRWEVARFIVTGFQTSVTRWFRQRRPNDVFMFASDGKVEIKAVFQALIVILESEGYVYDIRMFSGNVLDLDRVTDADLVKIESEQVSDGIEQASICEIKAVVRSGYMDLVSALVKVRLQRLSAEATHIEGWSIAKEPLIKQYTAEKTARSLAQWLEEAMVRDDDEQQLKMEEEQPEEEHETYDVVYDPDQDDRRNLSPQDYIRKKYWNIRLYRWRLRFYILAFFSVFMFISGNISGIPYINPDPNTFFDSFGADGLAPCVYWLFFWGYVWWKSADWFVKLYCIPAGFENVPSSVKLKAVLGRIARLKRFQILFGFGIVYMIFLTIMQILTR